MTVAQKNKIKESLSKGWHSNGIIYTYYISNLHHGSISYKIRIFEI